MQFVFIFVAASDHADIVSELAIIDESVTQVARTIGLSQWQDISQSVHFYPSRKNHSIVSETTNCTG
jgi:hypothetical protein